MAQIEYKMALKEIKIKASLNYNSYIDRQWSLLMLIWDEHVMIKYIYYECFNEKENSIDKIYKAIFNELKYNFNSIGPKIYTFYKIKKNQCI